MIVIIVGNKQLADLVKDATNLFKDEIIDLLVAEQKEAKLNGNDDYAVAVYRIMKLIVQKSKVFVSEK